MKLGARRLPGTNQVVFGTDLDLDLEPGSLFFPLFQHGEVGRF